jgi:hypothetical protein
MSVTVLTSPKCRVSSLNHQNVGLFGLVPKSPTHTGLICVNTLKPIISCLGPFKCICPETSTKLYVHEFGFSRWSIHHVSDKFPYLGILNRPMHFNKENTLRPAGVIVGITLNRSLPVR